MGEEETGVPGGNQLKLKPHRNTEPDSTLLPDTASPQFDDVTTTPTLSTNTASSYFLFVVLRLHHLRTEFPPVLLSHPFSRLQGTFLSPLHPLHSLSLSLSLSLPLTLRSVSAVLSCTVCLVLWGQGRALQVLELKSAVQ